MFPNSDTTVIKSDQCLWSIPYATHCESFEMSFYWIMHKERLVCKMTRFCSFNDFYEKFSTDGSCFQFVFDHI